MGSGKHSRVYLYSTPNGELYQLPIAWYTQEKRWAMAPGFDRPDHLGVHRRVRRECMFCHNAYPDVPAGSDLYGPYQTFPAELPEGLGCQRCHGPGAEHARLALLGGESEAEEKSVRARHRESGPPGPGAAQRRLLRMPHAALGRHARGAPIRPRRLLVPAGPGPGRLPGPDRPDRGRSEPLGAVRDQPPSLPPRAEHLLPGLGRQALLPDLPRSPSHGAARGACRSLPGGVPRMPSAGRMRPGGHGEHRAARGSPERRPGRLRHLPHAAPARRGRDPRGDDRPPHPPHPGRASGAAGGEGGVDPRA